MKLLLYGVSSEAARVQLFSLNHYHSYDNNDILISELWMRSGASCLPYLLNSSIQHLFILLMVHLETELVLPQVIHSFDFMYV